jgi:PAS domain S-box-containing protein
MTKKPTYEELEQRIKELEKVGVEHKRVEVALTESEEKYRNLFHRSNDAIFIHDLDGDIIDANQRVLDLFGYKKSEMSSIRIPAIHPAESLEKSKWAFETIIREGFINFEIEFKKKSDEVFSAEVSSSLFEIGGKQVIQGIVRDITDRKRAEEALRESEEKLFRSKKMESLGLLAGGVAHDLNNVLSGIVSYPEIILMDLPEGSKLRKPVKTILESGLRAVAIVQDLLTVARGVATAKERLNLNDLIGDYLNSPEFKKLEQFHPGITVKTNLDSDLMNISSSHVHIRKVLMNLVSNATEAIEGRGNVTISTTNRYIDRPLRAYDDVNIGEYAILAVSDDGSGISSDDLERIFEPFYTKKVMGRSGTGLGLAVIWNILQDHKGYIDVINDENGTTFELYFPITRDEVMYKDPSIPLEDLKGDGETILVVDDVESQREISCDVLDSLGYRTKSVSSGEEAVEYLKEHTVDLLLLDMIMAPGINGRETYERIIKIHPNQKAIIVSGFAETGEVKGAQQLGAGQYVKKPLTLKKIGIAVKEELDK